MNNARDNKNDPTRPDLDAALEALQAVVMAQKAQIDVLLASLESLLAALNSPESPFQGARLPAAARVPAGGQAPCFMIPVHPPQLERDFLDARVLGDPLDPQFQSLHQLMGRLKAA